MQSRSFIEDIKTSLSERPIHPQPQTARQIVMELKKAILDRIRNGDTPQNVYLIIREKMPSEIKMSYSSFNKYYLELRRTSGLGRTRRKGRTKSDPALPLPAPNVTLAPSAPGLLSASNKAPATEPVEIIEETDVDIDGIQTGHNNDAEDPFDTFMRDLTQSHDHTDESN